MTLGRAGCLALALAGLSACTLQEGGGPSFELAAGTTSPAEFGEIATFDLESANGGRVTREDLAGKPWLVGFIFTRCATICPQLVGEMSRAHKLLGDAGAPVVAITVDPEHDTVRVLNDYASHFEGTEDGSWLWLTGDEEKIYELIRKSFKLAVERDPDADPGLLVSHSSFLVAVDGAGKIRGYYQGTDKQGTVQAVDRVRFLAGKRDMLSAQPRLNAMLNGICALLLVVGLVAIRRKRKHLHARLMGLAFLFSAAFLASYLHYHFKVLPSLGGHVGFRGEGVWRTAYLVVLLLCHILGAVINLPMVLRTFWLARKQRWDDHRRMARRTYPLWLFVSISGVAVYFALYGA